MLSQKACKLFEISSTIAQVNTAAEGTEKRKTPARMGFLDMMLHLRNGWRIKSWDLVIGWKPPPSDRAELGVFSELSSAEFS